MPAIAKAMAVDPGTLGITLGIFTVGTGFGQIIFGPISERFGRKPVIIFGLSVYILAALIASCAANIEELSLIRFIQGIGAASGRIIGAAVVRNLYDKRKAARLLSNTWMVSSMMPILNPFIGSALIHYLNRNSVFSFTAIFAGIMILLTIFFLRKHQSVKIGTHWILISFSKIFHKF